MESVAGAGGGTGFVLLVRSVRKRPPYIVGKVAYLTEFGSQAGGDESAAKARLLALRGIPELEIDSECRNLAGKLIEDGAVPASSPEDALHIAVTAVHGIDSIATWNFKHINNNETRSKIRNSVAIHGYVCPEICSPDEFLGEDYE